MNMFFVKFIYELLVDFNHDVLISELVLIFSSDQSI